MRALILQLAGLVGAVVCGFLVSPAVGGMTLAGAAVFVGAAMDAHGR